MDQRMKDFMGKNSSFSAEEMEAIMKDLVIESYEKNTILLKQGEISSKCYFVLKGCVRQYFIDADGKEVTVNFFTEEQAVVLFKSYKNKVPSDYFLACNEESTLVVGTLESEETMYRQFPVLEKLTRDMVEENFGKEQDERVRFIAQAPEERYQLLLKQRPELINRVPQHQLASYLGITPESLSRIKRRISQGS
ncbi:Crp/Fnr family transcriptional regulator [Robertmurraya massiliosenegalensis]|uniref:Crp/Fnr family transcriptional regulator n=1 Tax=Robertmurraya massiliosenegalensis TaxID=1287657 RepID=UPI0002F0A355